jgi:polyphosphate kinase 2
LFIFECLTKEPIFHPNLKSTQMPFTPDHLQQATTRKELIALAHENNINIDKALDQIKYEIELQKLQSELVNLQQWIHKKQLRVAVIFEGRDASGKGGSIKRFIEHLNPRSSRVVALNKPTNEESRQWYFRRYIKVLPNAGELVFFDRSWYNRAVVEPVMGFCVKEQYDKFMVQVPEFEHMLYEDQVKVIKFWFSISKEEQKKRFESRAKNELKQWKLSPVDLKGQQLWDNYTRYKEQMFNKTHTSFSPWVIVKANNKKSARLESIRHVISQFDYPKKGESGIETSPDPNIIQRYHRGIVQIDI